MMRAVRRVLVWLGMALLLAVALLHPEAVRVGAWGRGWSVPLGVLILAGAVVGAAIVVLALWGTRRRGGHDPRLLLPRLLSRKVRHAIDKAYAEGSLEAALTTVLAERAREPDNLGLHYWSIRLRLDLGQSAEARAELIALLQRLPEAALTVRWSALFEQAGEQELWVANVLERIRSGLVVRRSTFRELVRLLENSGRYAEGLEVLERLRQIDPPTPEELDDLLQTELVLRVRLAEVMAEDGRAEQALAELITVRERATGWRSPYLVGARVLKQLGRGDEAGRWLLEGFRNTGDPDLLLTAYEEMQAQFDPVGLLAYWDEQLSDLGDDDWYLLTSGWVALRHGLNEEGGERLRRIEVDSPAYAHACIVLGGSAAERGHMHEAAGYFRDATWPWVQLPFVWSCTACGGLARHAAYVCPRCGGWESYRMIRPYSVGEPDVRPLVAL